MKTFISHRTKRVQLRLRLPFRSGVNLNLALICIPLVLSAFTHLFNSTGFPCVSFDEAIYVRRALHVLEGLGPQDPSSRFDHGQETNSSYDHPHFGQIFLAGIFQIIGYPSSLHTLPTVESIEMLYTVPRVLMGILAVVDTFLLYKIAERRYNRNVALVSSILFAVMPLSWLNRWILLDNILLPFLLLSILFALHVKRNNNNYNNNDIHPNLDFSKKNTNNSNDFRKITLTILSGIFLGLAIYTKITAFTMIPLVGFLIFTNNKSFKSLALWLVPVILIPSLWPVYALSVGQFDEWLDGVIWQSTERRVDAGENSPHSVLSELTTLAKMDPVLVIISIISTAYAVIRRDFLILLWIVPFLVLAVSIHWVYFFHFILLLPAACIASGLLIVEVPKRIIKKQNHQKLLTITTVSAIGIFGLVSTVIIISTNFSLLYFVTSAFLVKYADNSFANGVDDVSIILSPKYSWIFKYVFNKDHNIIPTREAKELITKNVLLLVETHFRYVMEKREAEDKKQIEQLQNIYDNTHPVATITMNSLYNMTDYPYESNLRSCEKQQIELRAN